LEKNMTGLRWNLVRIAFFTITALACLLPLALLPANLLPIAAFGATIGVLFAGWSIAKGDSWWGKAALLVGGMLLGISILLHLVAGSILSVLPSLLLAYVLLLFSAEGFTLVSEHHAIQSKKNRIRQPSYSMVKSSLEHLTRKSSRLAVVFGGCFVISLAALSAGDAFAAVAPALADLSIYIVAVSVSLALLLTFHED